MIKRFLKSLTPYKARLNFFFSSRKINQPQSFILGLFFFKSKDIEYIFRWFLIAEFPNFIPLIVTIGNII